jgi:hypothetical protein
LVATKPQAGLRKPGPAKWVHHYEH